MKKLKLLTIILLMSISCFSQNGILVEKIIIDNDTNIVITKDMLLEINSLIVEKQILTENVDSLTYVLEECNMNYEIQNKAIIGLNKQYNTLEKINNNSNLYIEKLEKDIKKEKKKTKIVGGVGIILLILGIIF